MGEKRSVSNRGARSPGKHHQARLRVGKHRVYHLHVTNPHAPPPSIALQCRFTWHAQNRVTNTRFWVWGLNPTPQPRVGEWADPPAPPCYPPAPTTSRHRSTSPFHTAHLKLSYKRSVSGFGPNPAPGLALVNAQSPPSPPCHPPAPSTSRHCSTPPFHTARPKSSQKRSVSGFGPNTTPQPCVGKCADPPTPPCYPPAPTTSHHRSTPPFHTAHPKSSQKHLVSGFGPNTTPQPQ
jgi:hypothetical protein